MTTLTTEFDQGFDIGEEVAFSDGKRMRIASVESATRVTLRKLRWRDYVLYYLREWWSGVEPLE
jgi:hypothetical protein